MRLTIREEERVQIWAIAEMARRRLARGVVLNYPEATALICDEIMERACEGSCEMLVDMMDYGATILHKEHVMTGVPEILKMVQVEAVFRDGTKLVTVMNPIRLSGQGATPQSWKSPPPIQSVVPDEAFPVGEPEKVGYIEFAEGDILINAGRDTIDMVITNSGDRPIQVGAHYHLSEANKSLAFDREAAFGFRLDVPSGTAVRFEPGQSRKVTLTRFVGSEVAMGMNDMTNGSLRSANTKKLTMDRLKQHGYRFAGEHADNKKRPDEVYGAKSGSGKKK
ncbi:MAG: urease subunit beta [Burkholderiales bacterium]|nr:urease subunit beta [Burkholderiales bacterium]